jgi:predicted DCC family thiol-disulfide oxidoreductase YuxK
MNLIWTNRIFPYHFVLLSFVSSFSFFRSSFLFSPFLFRSSPCVVLYDGDCAVCNWTINFIIDRDTKESFFFAALESSVGRAIQERFQDQLPKGLDSIILIEGAEQLTQLDENSQANSKEIDESDVRISYRSSAILCILCSLSSPVWSLFSPLLFLPLFVRDTGYKAFAYCRYTIFGRLSDNQTSECRTLTKQVKRRMLDMRKEWTQKFKEANKKQK